MSTPPVNYPEFIRFYQRVARQKPEAMVDRAQNKMDLLDISAEAKKRVVIKQAFNEVLEKIRQ